MFGKKSDKDQSAAEKQQQQQPADAAASKDDATQLGYDNKGGRPKL